MRASRTRSTIARTRSSTRSTYGRGLDHDQTDRFVGMYVNGLTLDYGERGRTAVRRFFDEAWEKRLIPAPVQLEFVSAS